ncbi:hypothetical protein ACQJBY_017846 [Aegilops geniculata]
MGQNCRVWLLPRPSPGLGGEGASLARAPIDYVAAASPPLARSIKEPCGRGASPLPPPPPPPPPGERRADSRGGASDRRRDDADLREDAHRGDRDARGRELRGRRQRQGQDPRQGRYPAGPAAPHLRGEAARRRPHPGRLQHPKGVHASPRAAPRRRWQGRVLPHQDGA